jgi:hypothetical protein
MIFAVHTVQPPIVFRFKDPPRVQRPVTRIAIKMHSSYRKGKHPLRVVRPSALHGRVYYSERTVHFDEFNSGCVYIVSRTGVTLLHMHGERM